jgi:hypothetical protein
MEDGKSAPPPEVVEALVTKLRAIGEQMTLAADLAREAREMQAAADSDFARAKAAAELWNINILEEMKKRMGAPDEPQPPLLPNGGAARPTVQQFTLVQAEARYPGPVFAAELRKEYERLYGHAVHEKTFGMTLYRLSQMDYAPIRREKRADWYFIPPDERTARGMGGQPAEEGHVSAGDLF